MLPSVILTMLAGPAVPLPAPDLAAVLDSASVSHSDEGRSTFQVVFRALRDATTGLLDHPLLLSQRLKVGTRLVLMVTVNAIPQVLMDGIITHQQLNPGDKPGSGSITVTGEDLGVLLDQIELRMPFPGNDTALAYLLLAPYAAVGLVPLVLPPPTDIPPDPTREIPHPQGTAWAILSEKARQHSCSFFIFPGPLPGQSTAYFGPRIPAFIPQRALTTGMGAANTVTSISFQHDGTTSTQVVGLVQDDSPAVTLPPLPVYGVPVLTPPLATLPSLYVNQPIVKLKYLEPTTRSNYVRALLQASSETTSSTVKAVTASGELDTARYGMVLYARQLVGVRGAGYSFDGLYYVKSVSHTIKRGEYKQSFQLSREGLGSTVPAVIP
ncbi:hypothetical protein MYSTI_06901 [Myxococcus stipitatus DSM 14675]|uniref:Uncharacterized protein n=1 Tax=Myxococcus stipitatus (strain DSM 14675 / JCM 12634 / Mx s8) TaxID=1278073 RepID=L7UNV6_MYXSD|nr:hypothetical protein [Myxococcus stipitatus]AGC48174.1 hypothetical protein MYSTI_06901 [Myxococcus stipitatus DSM 14675]